MSTTSEMCIFCDRPAQTDCPDCGQEFCDYGEHRQLHLNPADGKCLPIRIRHSEKVGRYVVAGRDISAGETLFEDRPLVAGPNQETQPICLTCDNPVDLSYKCSSCQYPFCDEACATHPSHALSECSILARGATTQDFSPSDSYHAVLPLRLLLLRQSSPRAYAFTRRLMDHTEQRQQISEYWKESQVKVVDRLLHGCGLADDGEFSESDVNRAVGVLEVNAYEVKSKAGCSARALYPLASLLSHGCTSNAICLHAHERPYRAKCVALVDIPAGEEITSKYLPSIVCSLVRRPAMRDGWYFDCTCSRCADPTENGSHINTLLCQACANDEPEDGTPNYMLPIEPLNYDSPWKCQRCAAITEASVVEKIINDFLDRVIEVSSNHRYDLDAMLALHDEASKLVHPNHHVLCDLAKWIAPIYCRGRGQTIEDFSREDLERKRDMCRRQADVLQMVSPGMTTPWGKYVFEYIDICMHLIAQDFEAGGVTVKKLAEELASYRAQCREAISALRLEPTPTHFEKFCMARMEIIAEQCRMTLNEIA